MNKVYCDRCGKEIDVSNEKDWYVYPKYRVTNGDSTFLSTSVDLCEECEKKFDEWLKSCGTEKEEDAANSDYCTFIFSKSSPFWCESGRLNTDFLCDAAQRLNDELCSKGIVTMSHIIKFFGLSTYGQRHACYGWAYASGDRIELQYEILSNGAFKISTNARLLSGGEDS